MTYKEITQKHSLIDQLLNQKRLPDAIEICWKIAHAEGFEKGVQCQRPRRRKRESQQKA